jgi:7,8-dihydropterin-6-yl-methyl-4-(beta-D-ribofuranosyl)aminobenzene 5'-phosphate synthase
MKLTSVQDLKITTLAENSATSILLGQWGLSFLLEMTDAKGKKRKIILDTGKYKRALLHNLKNLNVNLNDVDCVVLSHGHLDHTGTTVEIVKMAGGVKVYAHPHTFFQRFHQDKTGKKRQLGVPKGEGIPEIEKAGGTVLLTRKPTEIVPGVTTTGQIERTTSFERPLPISKTDRLVIIVDGKETDDHILDDQALWMQVDGIGPYVITGCAHSGIINTLTHVQKIGQLKQIHGLVGGTHLVGRSDEYLQKTVTDLKKFGLKLISPCHCTGFKATATLWRAYPETFVLNFSGRIIEAGKETKPRIT